MNYEYVTCAACAGTGKNHTSTPSKPVPCVECGGAGRVPRQTVGSRGAAELASDAAKGPKDKAWSEIDLGINRWPS